MISSEPKDVCTKTGAEPEDRRTAGGGGAVFGLGAALEERALTSAPEPEAEAEAEAALEEAGEALRGREYHGDPGEGNPRASALLFLLLLLLRSLLPPATVSRSLWRKLTCERSAPERD